MEKTTCFEYIVVGCGGIGSGALYWLSKRSQSVLGLEQFQLGHVRGGSQDFSRIIRLSYHDACYTKIARDSYTAWQEIEAKSGIQVTWMTGRVQLAKKGVSAHKLETFMKAMDAYNIEYEKLDNQELMSRFPQFTVDQDVVGLYQRESGLVDAALGNAIHVQLARGNGAKVVENCPVIRLSKTSTGNVLVHTTKGVFECRKVIVTAGGWLNSVLGTIGVHIPVTVTQEQVTYFATPHMKEFTKERYPVWGYLGKEHNFYALPIHGNTGTKIGIDAGGPPVTADTRTFEPDPVQENICSELVKEICPKFHGPILETKTCLYTMPPDRHFVVDTCGHKGWSDVIVCCGAGHAYKFAGLLGKILSELAVDGRTSYDISQFSITRPALHDPKFEPDLQFGGKLDSKL